MAAKRRIVQPLLVVMLLLGACAALAGTHEKAQGAANPPGVAKAPAAAAKPSVSATDSLLADTGIAATLTRRLTGSTGVTDAVAATREALALGGLATRDRQRFLVKATAPAASGFVLPQETVALALEARQRPTAGRLTLAQLGDMLKDLGWPFREGSLPGEQLRDIFRAWVTDGLAQPGDLLSFTPLFLRDMALTQQPPIDLAKGDYDPEQLHLTLLELELFTAHFDRISGPAARASGDPAKGDYDPGQPLLTSPELEPYAGHVDGTSGPSALASWSGDPGLSQAMPTAQAGAGPCPELKKWLDSAFSDFDDPGEAAAAAVRILIGDSVKAGLKEALQAAGFTAAAAQQFGKALSALSIASRLWKLVALYTDAQVAVTVEANPIHAPSSSEGKKTDVFRARAGVSDRDWEEYRQAMTSSDDVRGLRDCFRVFGLPVLPDLGDMGKEAKDWHMEWRLEGALERVRINEADNSFAHPGFLRVDLKPDGDHSAAAPFTVEILPEKGSHSGPEKQAIAVASAALHTAKPPSIATWVNAVKGGLGNLLALSNALVELCAGWIAEMAPPKAYANLTVTYHESVGVSWSGRITYKKIKMVDKAKSGRNAGGYAFMLYNVDYWSATNTVEVSGGNVRAKTQLEEIWDLSGFAAAILKEEHLTDNWHDDNGCKAKEVATEHERDYSVMNAGGTGPVTGDLIINNNGTYQLNFLSAPEVKGETETWYDSWWENKPCVNDERHDQYSDPRSGGHGPGISVAGKLDPKKPGVLSGQYEVTDPNGYTITVTWNLRQKY